MQTYVYKSLKKADNYLFLADRDGFGRVPEAIHSALAPFEFVMELALDPTRKLARADAASVMANLAACGFHLQVPPRDFAAPPVEP